MKSIEVRQSVNIYVWKFKNERNYQGWNIACDQACAKFVINVLEKMKKEGYSTRYMLKTKKPDNKIIEKVSFALTKSKIVSVDSIMFVMKNTQECKIQFNEHERCLEVSFHIDFILIIQKYFLNILEGVDDIGLECNDDILVFWRL